MKILEIKEIVRKDVPIYYRRVFTGVAVMDILGQQLDKRIEFAIETRPTGAKDVSVSMVDTVDYPLVTLQKELRTAIVELDKAGKLPC